MYNQVTDRFKLVQTELVKAVPVFGRTITAVKDSSMEVFSGEFYRGSVRMPESEFVEKTGQEYDKLKVYDGEIIFQVSLASHPMSISGHVMTKDKYIRIYDITFDIVISNPTLFIQAYRLGKDPINVAIDYCKKTLQDHASRTPHDKLTRIEKLGEEWNSKLREKTGIRALRLSYWSLRDDPRRKEIDTVKQEAEIQRLKDRLARGREAENKAFEREQETLDHMHDLHLGLRTTAAQEITEILRERIRYTFERGSPIDEVAEDSMRLLNAFHESLHRGSTIDSTLSSETHTSSNGTSSQEDPISSSQKETDPSLQTPSNLSDLSRTKETETETDTQ
jgi:hypothetical protein